MGRLKRRRRKPPGQSAGAATNPILDTEISDKEHRAFEIEMGLSAAADGQCLIIRRSESGQRSIREKPIEIGG